MRDYSDDGRSGMGTLAALLLGMAIGAAAVVLSNREMREELMDRLQELKRKGERKVSEAKKEAEEAQAKGRKRIGQELEKAQKEVETPRR
jgi:signal transduction histidine kinase